VLSRLSPQSMAYVWKKRMWFWNIFTIYLDLLIVNH